MRPFPKLSNRPWENKPCAVAGLLSYRYPDSYGGWIMIGATDDLDAMKEAHRSTNAELDYSKLEKWNGTAYEKANK